MGMGKTCSFIGTSMVSINLGLSGYLLHGGGGLLLQLYGSNDSGSAFQVTCITPKVDVGNNRTKFWGQMEIIGDRPSSSCLPSISFSDDDYRTWSAPRTVDLNTPRPIMYRNGSSRRRAIKFDLLDNTDIRLEGYELVFEQGN